MDERADSYFMLEDEDEALFLSSFAAGFPLLSDQRLQDAFVIDGAPAEILRAICPDPKRSVADEANVHGAALAEIVWIAWLVYSTRAGLAKKPIEKILADILTCHGHCEADGNPERLIGDARRFMTARRLVPIKPNCLLDSLSLLRWLGPARSGAMLVFGAKLDPFAAHCWVQADDLLLNDALEAVARFRAVRVVRCSRATH
ncbi:MAG: lasso peptide biosynthesis B2 protein [Pseudomonadota bacterium]|nr:lasso peptide biosynthesis B2 protein [Pseudomonadota bacterium]